jgi:hypothetical protein
MWWWWWGALSAMCPHTTMSCTRIDGYVSSYYTISDTCVLILVLVYTVRGTSQIWSRFFLKRVVGRIDGYVSSYYYVLYAH